MPAASAPLESHISAPGPAGQLKGTLLSPQGEASAVVLMIPGSGPVDRDGNSPAGVKAATLKLLAEGLAGAGIASVRIDKRGLYGSAGAVPDANAVTIEDYARDARAWIAAIRARTGVRCVFVLGHSEGGLVALVAGRDDPDVCGLILVATAGRPLGAVLAEQLAANPANAPVLDEARAAIARLEAGQAVDAAQLHPALRALFSPAIQGFLINVMGFDPARLIGGIREPVLILQGARDIQVGIADAERLKAANPAAELVLLPATNHVLKQVASDARGANLATYADPHLPLAPGIVEAIARFVKASGR